jgi:membrane fusion protein (multidrug efflux system)
MRSLPRWTLAVAAAAIAVGGWLVYTKGSDDRGGMGGPRPVAVVAKAISPQPFEDRLEAVGTLDANESITVTSKVTAVVTAIRFVEGQQVSAGQVLVATEDSEARANLAAAEAAELESRNAWERGKLIYGQQLISKSELDQLDAKLKADHARVLAAQAQLAEHTVRAPFAGRVGLRRVSIGALVNAGTQITTLDDTATMKLDFSVPETFLAAVRAGLEIQARASAFPETLFTGKVATVDTRVDPETRSVAVRALLPNPKGLLRPGMFLTVNLIRERVDALLVPEQALVPEQDKQFVFVVVADGDLRKAMKREVRIGRRQPGIVEVVSGLAVGEQVIVEGTLKVRDGAPVTLPGDPVGAAGAAIGASAPPTGAAPPTAKKKRGG